MYAHTGDTDLRQILEFATSADRATWVRERADLSEQWFPPTPTMLDDVVALAVANLQTFLAEIDKLCSFILAADPNGSRSTL